MSEEREEPEGTDHVRYKEAMREGLGRNTSTGSAGTTSNLMRDGKTGNLCVCTCTQKSFFPHHGLCVYILSTVFLLVMQSTHLCRY